MKHLKNFMLLLAGALIYGVGTHCFIAPANIAPGGALGIAMMANYITGLPIGILTLMVNIPLLVLAWIYLNRDFIWKTLLAVGLSSWLLDAVISPLLPQYTGDRLLGCIYGGVLAGAGIALIFLTGCTTGGSDIVGYLLQLKLPHVSIGRALLMIDSVVLVISIFVFRSVDAALFGMINLYAQTKVIDTILYGYDAGSQATIITDKPREIADKIIARMGRTATFIAAKGAFSEEAKTVVLVVVRNSEFAQLKSIINACDPGAFVMVNETSQVLGLGFKKL